MKPIHYISGTIIAGLLVLLWLSNSDTNRARAEADERVDAVVQELQLQIAQRLEAERLEKSAIAAADTLASRYEKQLAAAERTEEWYHENRRRLPSASGDSLKAIIMWRPRR